MPDLPQFALRKVYNFDMYAPGVLGASFKNATVLALMDRKEANRFIDTQGLHTQVYAELPAGWPNSPEAYDYVKIKTSAGLETVLGLAWIKADSVELVESRVITATVSGVGAGDLPRVRQALRANGFMNIELSISN
jgi:hypothetical protein